MQYSRPRALRTGDRVAVVAASSPPDQERLDLGVAAIQSLGVEVDVFKSAREAGGVYDYLAGDDGLRAADLTAALADPAYAAVFLARGGYGAQRTLEHVDWDAVDRLSPKVVVGFSDVTALLEAVAVKLGWVSLFGPVATSEGFHLGRGHYPFDVLTRLLFMPETVRELTFPGFRTLVPGVAEGVTLGGTATLLAASIGTDTSLPARDGILFLEDVGELPYRLDRIITQLRRSGYLDGVAGILLGTFTGCGEDVEAMLAERLGDLGVPILAGADIGHGVAMQTYPIGVRARLDAECGTLTFLEPVLASQ